MAQYAAEEAASGHAAQSLKERIDARKRELAEKKASEVSSFAVAPSHG
jgi:hypothetical protein